MGREIVYCEVCGDRILEWEFEEGRAVTWENKNFCFKCKTTAIEKLGKDAFQEAVLQDPPAVPTPEPEEKKMRSSSRFKAVNPEPAPAPASEGPPPLPVSRPMRRRSRFGHRSGMSSTRMSRVGDRGGRGDRGAKGERDKESRFPAKKKTNWMPWLIGGGVVLLLLIIIIASSGGKKAPAKKSDRQTFEDLR